MLAKRHRKKSSLSVALLLHRHFLYTVYSTMYNMYSVQYKVYTLYNCTVYTENCTVYTENCTHPGSLVVSLTGYSIVRPQTAGRHKNYNEPAQQSTCTALHCTALPCSALLGTALQCTALTALHFTSLHCTAMHCTALHCAARHNKKRTCVNSHSGAVWLSPNIK